MTPTTTTSLASPTLAAVQTRTFAAARTRIGAQTLAMAVAVVLLGMTGCTGASQPPTERPPSPPSDEATAVTEPAELADVRIELQPLVRGLDAPLFLTHAADGSDRMFVVEQGGRVRVILGDQLQKEPYLDVSDRISSGGERGLLGLAFAPDFARNGRFYVNYTDTAGDTIVARFTADDPSSNQPRLEGPQTVLKVAQPYPNHNGGCIKFGPDGYLYVGIGDGGSGGDPQGNAQNPKRLLGKMLRIDVEGASATGGKQYAIPEDNPFASNGEGAPEIWMLGLRNPWRFSFDRETQAMWIGDVGQNAIEEIDVAEPGEGGQNWGWNVLEGNQPYEAEGGRAPSSFAAPVAQYTHKQGQSITGGYVYRGTRYPELEGLYLYADFVAGWIGGMRSEDATSAASGTALTRQLLDDVGNPASFGEDESGELYLVDLNGTISRIAVPR